MAEATEASYKFTWQENDGGRRAAGFAGTARDCVTRATALFLTGGEADGETYARIAEAMGAANQRYARRLATSNRRVRAAAKVVTQDRGIFTDASDRVFAELGIAQRNVSRMGLWLNDRDLPPVPVILAIPRHLIFWDGERALDTHDSFRVDRKTAWPSAHVERIYFAPEHADILTDWERRVRPSIEAELSGRREAESAFAQQRRGWQKLRREAGWHESIKEIAGIVGYKKSAADSLAEMPALIRAWRAMIDAGEFDFAWAHGVLPFVKNAERFARYAKARELRQRWLDRPEFKPEAISEFRRELEAHIANEQAENIGEAAPTPEPTPEVIEADGGQLAWQI